MAVADRREQVPPVQATRQREADVLEDVERRVLERGVVDRGDVPRRHRGDVEAGGEDGVAERPGGALELHQPARRRAQDHAGEGEDPEDRRDVEQQQVLEHVHRQDLLAEPVDRGDQRRGDRHERAREAGRAPARGVVAPGVLDGLVVAVRGGGRPCRAEAPRVERRGRRDQHDRAEVPGPRRVHGGAHPPDLAGPRTSSSGRLRPPARIEWTVDALYAVPTCRTRRFRGKSRVFRDAGGGTLRACSPSSSP